MLPQRPANTNREAGFTLIEFCVATLIMLVGLMGLLQGVNIAYEQNLGNMLRNEAVCIVDEQMVAAINAATYTADGVTATGFNSLVTIPAYSVTRKMRGGSRTFSVLRTVTAQSTQTKEVNIKVSWTYKSKTLSHQATSLVLSPL